MKEKVYWIYSRQAGKAEDRMEGINHYDWGGITDEQRAWYLTRFYTRLEI